MKHLSRLLEVAVFGAMIFPLFMVLVGCVTATYSTDMTFLPYMLGHVGVEASATFSVLALAGYGLGSLLLRGRGQSPGQRFILGNAIVFALLCLWAMPDIEVATATVWALLMIAVAACGLLLDRWRTLLPARLA